MCRLRRRLMEQFNVDLSVFDLQRRWSDLKRRRPHYVQAVRDSFEGNVEEASPAASPPPATAPIAAAFSPLLASYPGLLPPVAASPTPPPALMQVLGDIRDEMSRMSRNFNRRLDRIEKNILFIKRKI
ncbi:hypothetical protein GDO86_020428 [Hymenochirus boettgeri]|uniref:Uncharacterized protein n=1 Tax=Hymenochirus boettgeri TaxID=247094 RepID=A0A8T2ILJ7_9PIPI|nr:hypothetical protein GDO86_020428 [Hymenochirus boettgeri]